MTSSCNLQQLSFQDLFQWRKVRLRGVELNSEGVIIVISITSIVSPYRFSLIILPKQMRWCTVCDSQSGCYAHSDIRKSNLKAAGRRRVGSLCFGLFTPPPPPTGMVKQAMASTGRSQCREVCHFYRPILLYFTITQIIPVAVCPSIAVFMSSKYVYLYFQIPTKAGQ